MINNTASELDMFESSWFLYHEYQSHLAASGSNVIGSYPQSQQRLHYDPVDPLANFHQRMNHVQFGSSGFWFSGDVRPEDETLMVGEIGRESINFNTTFPVDNGTFTISEIGLIGRDDRNKSSGLSEETINRSLKTRTYYQAPCGEIQDSAKTCVVCQAEYAEGEALGRLECGHEYHSSCLHKWLLQKNACPLCRCTAIHQESI